MPPELVTEAAPPNGAPAAPVAPSREAARAAGRAAFLAADPAAAEPAAEKPVAEPEEPADDAEAEPTEDADEPSPAAEDDEETPDPDAEEDVAPVEPAKATKDPDLDKRLAAVQKAEKRARETVATERAAFDRDRAKFESEWKPRVEAAQKAEQSLAALRARAKHDLVGVAEELGISPDDFDFHAQQFYRRTPKAAADPRNREAVASAQREREQREKLSATEQRLADMERKLEERDKRADAERTEGRLVAAAQQHVSDATPIMRALFKARPDIAQQRIVAATKFLREQTGYEPDPADVVAQLEEIEQADAAMRGFVLPAAKVAPKTQTRPADETKTAPKKPTSDPGTSQPRTLRVGKEEQRRNVIAALEKGLLE